jgi:hypothetical protein
LVKSPPEVVKLELLFVKATWFCNKMDWVRSRRLVMFTVLLSCCSAVTLIQKEKFCIWFAVTVPKVSKV